MFLTFNSGCLGCVSTVTIPEGFTGILLFDVKDGAAVRGSVQEEHVVGVSTDFYPHGEGKFPSNKSSVSSARILSIRILWKDKKLGNCWKGAQSSGPEETARVLLPVCKTWFLPMLARNLYG